MGIERQIAFLDRIALALLPLIGGIIADRYTGRRTIILVGHGLRISGLLLLVIASVKPFIYGGTKH